MKLFILFLCLISQFKTCTQTKPMPDNQTDSTVTKYISLKFSEPMAALDALNKNNYIVIDQNKDTIKIKEIRYIHHFKKPDSLFVRFTQLVIIPEFPLIPGDYRVIFKDLKDFSVNVMKPNPKKITIYVE